MHARIHSILSQSLTILTFGLQVALTFIITMCIYMVFALLDYDGGFDRLIGMVLFQPVIAFILSGLTVFSCLIFGLPIRLIKSINHWWTKHFYVAIGLAMIGIALLALSLTPQLMQHTTALVEEQQMVKLIPHPGLAITGWLLTAFSVLHTYPPIGLTQRVQNILANLTGSYRQK